MDKSMYDLIMLAVAIISMIAGVIATVFSITSYFRSDVQTQSVSERRETIIWEERIYTKSSSNDEIHPFFYIFIIFVGYCVVLYYFLSYKIEIVNITLGVIFSCTLIAGLFTMLSRSTPIDKKSKIWIVSSWILLFIPICFIKYSMFSSDKYKNVVSTILDSKGQGIVWVVADLFKTNTYDVLYITFQALAIVLLIPIVIINFLFIKRSITNSFSYNSELKNFTISFLIIFSFQLLFTTGVLARLISTISQYSSTT